MSGGESSGVGIVQGEIVRDGNCPGGNCPVGSRPGWELSRGEFSGVGTVRVGIIWVGIVRGGNYLGGNCPGGTRPGGSCLRGNCPGVLVQGGVVRSPFHRPFQALHKHC